MEELFTIVEKICNDEQVTVSQIDTLSRWLDSEEGRRLFKDGIEQKLEVYHADSVFDYDTALKKLHARGITVGTTRKPMRRFVRWAAAAVVVAAAATTFFWISDRQPEHVFPTYSGIFGSEGKAVLTLSDGTAIVMNEFADKFVEEAGVTVRVDEGTLDYQHTEPGQAMAFHEIYIPVGGEYKITLSDGTTVWLNSDTRLKYPMSFVGEERRLKLEGEAYFEVARDEHKPFIVETAGQTVTVLGTQFNVLAYPDESTIRTTLVSGSVRVTTAGGRETVMSPGQQSRLDTVSGELSVQEVDVTGITAWKDGYLVIEEQTLEQIMNKISRWYGTQFTIDSDVSPDRTFRGVIPKYDINDTLTKLEMISGLNIELDGNIIRVKK